MAKRPKPVPQMTAAQFDTAFPDEEACKAYLVARRWPDGVHCPRCGNPKVYDLPDHLGYTFQVLQAFERGDFYPRWLASLNDGFGEATYVFYPPVLHFTSAALA